MSEIIESQEEAESIDLDEAITAQLANMSMAEKDMWLRATILLNHSERYSQFLNENFDIHFNVDDESKQISVVVVEKPEVKTVELKSSDMQIDVQKSLKAQMLLKKHNCENTAEVMKGIYEILTNTPADELVTNASEADIRRELDAIKHQAKLKG